MIPCRDVRRPSAGSLRVISSTGRDQHNMIIVVLPGGAPFAHIVSNSLQHAGLGKNSTYLALALLAANASARSMSLSGSLRAQG